MRKSLAAPLAAASLCSFAMTAQAQSSVTMYGIVDAGLTYVNNSNGHAAWLTDTGVQQGNRLGFKGTEDLGGGLKALFVLESGFNLSTGAMNNGGIFGRQAYVGLSNSYGTLTMGHQYDFMGDVIGNYSIAYVAGVYAFHQGDYDRISGDRLDNTIKFVSKSFGGLTAGGMYSFGNVAGDFRKNSAMSFGLTYDQGSLSLGAAYTGINNFRINPTGDLGVSTLFGQPLSGTAFVADSMKTWGLGGSYSFGKFGVMANYTGTRIAYQGNAATLTSVEGSLLYHFTPALVGGAGYTWSKLENSHWGQTAIGLDYSLSKRTDVYAEANYQQASGDGTQAVVLTLPTSSTNKQLAMRIGMRHRF
ncbi:porin [Paraburkholderia hayleyella]|uniref:porin n=1 Tax=Paraburkholderia hayleyella TaxID=2152889 RepID=UPI0012925CD5|nr:porin [Paraburkholderia hayleyella]